MATSRLIAFINSADICKYWVLICFHIIGDFILQTDFLANAKAYKFWKDLHDKTYKNKDHPVIDPSKDWIMPMLAHSFLWSCCVHYPIIISSKSNPVMIAGSILMHTIIHATIDFGKANKNSYGLFGDQLFHLLQLLLIIFI